MQSTTDIFSLTFEKAIPNLSSHELHEMSRVAIEEAGVSALFLRDVTNGIGCLVSSDTTSGQFQEGNSLSSLMFFIGQQADMLSTLTNISALAGEHIQRRAQQEQSK